MLKPRCGSGSFLLGAVGRAEPRSSGPKSRAAGGCLAPALAVTSLNGLPPARRNRPPGSFSAHGSTGAHSGWGQACLGIRSHYQWELKWTVNHRTPWAFLY